MLGGMSVKKDVFKPVYRLFPSSLKERFDRGELDVKALFLVSELSYDVLKRRVPKDTSPKTDQGLPAEAPLELLQNSCG